MSMGDGVGDLAFWIAVAVASASFWAAMTPLIKAFAKRIEGRVGDERLALLEQRLADLEQRGLTSGEVEAQFVRLADVEERLDFAERMLAKVEPTTPEGMP